MSPQQPDLTHNPLPCHRRQRDVTRDLRYKRPHMPNHTGLACATCTVPVALESNGLEESQSAALVGALSREREIRDIDEEIVDGGTDNPNDEDYDDVSDAAASEIQGRPRARKRVRTKATEHNAVEIPSTQSLNVSYQAVAPISSGSTQESEDIPIHGYLTLKTIESEVVYCLTFSQHLSPEPSGTSQKQGIVKTASGRIDRRDPKRLPGQERTMSRLRFSPEDDELLRRLKGDGLSWDEISDQFPERSKGTLQVHYSTKLKPSLETSKHTRKHRRSG